MKKHVKNSFWNPRRLVRCAAGLALLAGTSGVLADDLAAARFKGAPTYDLTVTNVTWEPGTKDYSWVTFDLSWGHSWRAKWVEPAKTSATGKDLAVENWDAVWVFVKFLPEKISMTSRERNHWQHATLDTDAANHVMPAGATGTVKHSDDGDRGMGVFIYRDAPGAGPVAFKGIKLRWQHGTDQVEPEKAAIAVHPIAMVYVPEGPFKVGTAEKSGYAPFADGPDVPITRYDGENSFNSIPEGLRKIIETTTSKDGGPYLQWAADPSWSRLTDGGWRGGPMIPFLVDAEWNAPVASGLRARRVGPVAGQLWSTLGFSERGGGSGGMFGSQIGGNIPLTDDFPTGYDAFYCMKYDLTQGQYVDFLNSLPPDVAAGRAFVSSEVSSDAAMNVQEITVKHGRGSYTVVEKGGHTIRSSADVPTSVSSGPARIGDPEDGSGDNTQAAGQETATRRPVYMARCPFRRLPGITGTDTRAYAVWAGLRPMSVMENTKAGVGARDPVAPADWAPPPDLSANPVLLDAGLPTERFAKGNSRYGADLATRVGCRSTPTSDRGTALATYWGISELGGPVIPLTFRGYRGTHGNGTSPAGKPGASVKRVSAPFNDTPPDWPDWGSYTSGHFVGGTCRLVVSAENRIKKPLSEQTAPVAAKPAAPQATQPARTDTIQVSNIKWEAGAKDTSTVSFDLSWNASWRTKWEEPADKNVTGKPLQVESWDAAWVFVKFRPASAKDELHGTLAVAATDHRVPADADLAVGLTDDGSRGTGVFIYRKAAGVGANDFKGVQLRWLHDAGPIPDIDVQVSVHALAMVYIPEGPFASRSPWGHALTVISTPNATQPGGHLESGPETVPLSDEWPNGFPAYYCMKYSITQGEYADFLNSVRSLNCNRGRYGVMAKENKAFFNPVFYNFNGYTIMTNAAGVFKADVPDRRCNMLSLFDIQGFIAWAGLRMPTNLEYEKACRGPRAVASGADAWKPATCAPATGLDKSVLGEPPAVGPGPSYWGIRELSVSGCVQEWPAVIQNERAAEGHKGVGIGDRGLHGSGSPEIPESWPWNCFAEWYYGGIWRLWGYGTVGHWVAVEDLNRLPFAQMDMNRTGRYGARAVRTAPIMVAANAMLQIDALPKLTGLDIGLVYLSGRLNNTGDKPLNVELAAAFPDVCFLDGAASRALTAVPKAVTPFKIALAVTRQSVMTGAIRGGMLLPVQLKGKDGQALETLLVPIQMGARAGAPLPVISSIRGGEVTLRITNTTDRAFTLAARLSPVGVTLATTNTTVAIAAGAGTQVVSAAPRQAFNQAGACRIPYGIAVATAAPQSGEAAVELRTESRWWITKRVKNAPKAGAPDEGPGDGDDLGGALAGLGDLVSYDGSIFKADKPSKDWTPLTCGASLVFGDAGKLPSHGSAMLAATRVEASADREAVMAVQHATKERFDVTVWVNDAMVFKLGGRNKNETKPFTLRKAGNTMMVECRSAETGAVTPGALSLQFNGAKDGKPITGLLFDMENR